jgi:hypothetical protein
LDEGARSRSQSALEEQDARGQNLKIDETHIGRNPSKGAEFGNQHRASSIARLREADHCEIGSAYNNLKKARKTSAPAPWGTLSMI